MVRKYDLAAHHRGPHCRPADGLRWNCGQVLIHQYEIGQVPRRQFAPFLLGEDPGISRRYHLPPRWYHPTPPPPAPTAWPNRRSTPCHRRSNRLAAAGRRIRAAAGRPGQPTTGPAAGRRISTPAFDAAFQRSLVSRRMASSFSRALPPEAAGATEKRSRMSSSISSISWSRM